MTAPSCSWLSQTTQKCDDFEDAVPYPLSFSLSREREGLPFSLYPPVCSFKGAVRRVCVLLTKN